MTYELILTTRLNLEKPEQVKLSIACLKCGQSLIMILIGLDIS